MFGICFRHRADRACGGGVNRGVPAPLPARQPSGLDEPPRSWQLNRHDRERRLLASAWKSRQSVMALCLLVRASCAICLNSLPFIYRLRSWSDALVSLLTSVFLSLFGTWDKALSSILNTPAATSQPLLRRHDQFTSSNASSYKLSGCRSPSSETRD